MLDKALLDSAATDALLQLAYSEGMLHENRRETDAFLAHVARRPAPGWVKERVLQQIVLTPVLETLRPLPREGLTGELVETGVLTQIEWHDPQPSTQQKVPAEIVQGMLEAGGRPWSMEEIQERIDRVALTLAEGDQYRATTGRDLPTVYQRIVASTMRFRQGNPANPTEAYGDYTQDDIDMVIRHGEISNGAKPIATTIDELLQMISYGRQTGALIRPSFRSRTETTLLSTFAPQHAEGARAISLFRLVARELDAPSARSTLRETLQLARSSAAVSLRENIPHWLDEILAGNLNPASRIANEISKATKQLARTSAAKRGKLFGYVAVAVDVVDAFLKIAPPVGLLVQLIDEVHKRKSDEREQHNRWVLLGNRD